MIKMCDSMNINELSFLEFIEEGNEIDKGLGLSKDQFLEAVKILATEYSE